MNHQSILSELGESYEYIKILVEKRIELAKLDLAQMAARLVGRALLIVFILSIGILMVFGLCVMTTVWLSGILNSLTLAILIVCIALLLIGCLLYVGRNSLFYRPTAMMIYKILENDQDQHHE